MKKYLIAGLLALASASVFADRTYSTDGLFVRLGEKACSDPKVVAITKMAEEGLGIGKQTWKEASIVFQKQPFKACYTESQGQDVLIVDESGDGGVLPKSLFKPGKSV